MAPWWTDRSIWLGSLVSLAGVAAVTVLIYALREVMPVEGAGVVYVLPVVLVSTRWGLSLGLATALLSALAFGFFHLPPTNSLSLSSDEDWVALLVFLAVAFVTSGLARTTRALTEEQEALRRVATEVAKGAVAVADLHQRYSRGRAAVPCRPGEAGTLRARRHRHRRRGLEQGGGQRARYRDATRPGGDQHRRPGPRARALRCGSTASPARQDRSPTRLVRSGSDPRSAARWWFRGVSGG